MFTNEHTKQARQFKYLQPRNLKEEVTGVFIFIDWTFLKLLDVYSFKCSLKAASSLIKGVVEA